MQRRRISALGPRASTDLDDVAFVLAWVVHSRSWMGVETAKMSTPDDYSRVNRDLLRLMPPTHIVLEVGCGPGDIILNPRP